MFNNIIEFIVQPYIANISIDEKHVRFPISSKYYSNL